MPAAAVLISPWVDLTCCKESWERAKGLDYLSKEDETSHDARLELPRLYAGSLPLTHPHISPLNASLQGFPPLLVQVSTFASLHPVSSLRPLASLQFSPLDPTLTQRTPPPLSLLANTNTDWRCGSAPRRRRRVRCACR
jgi:acetyl esterase/lipase